MRLCVRVGVGQQKNTDFSLVFHAATHVPVSIRSSDNRHCLNNLLTGIIMNLQSILKRNSTGFITKISGLLYFPNFKSYTWICGKPWINSPRI
jgi:hypothetical protein